MTVSLVVSGYVQNVGFRNYVQITAKAMGVTGEVWNGLDRHVHIIAQHDDPAVLERFKEEMWRGPGRVDEVREEPLEAGPLTGFRVSETR